MRILLGCLLLLCALAAHAQERYYRIEIGGKHIGYAYDVRQKTSEGIQVSYRTSIKISMLGSPADLDYQAIGVYKAENRLPKRFSATLDAMNHQITVDCRFQGSSVNARVTSAGSTTVKRITLPSGAFLLEGNLISTWSPIFRSLGSFSGTKWVTVFAPLDVATEKMSFKRIGVARLKISGKTVPCEVLEGSTTYQKLKLWVSRQDRTLVQMEDSLQKARITLSDRSTMAKVERAEVLSRVFAVSNVILPPFESLETLKAKVRVKVVGEKITPSSLRRAGQRFEGTVKDNIADGVFTMRRQRFEPKQSPTLSQLIDQARKMGLARYLKPSSRIESDASEIKALSRQLLEGSPDAWQSVIRLAGWVQKNIRYRITGGSALEALRSKEGDCGPHTFLTIALCRAAGIPARMIGGAMYSPATLGGSFGQHYWVEAWMGKDGWVPLDPTTGEVGILSPVHITFWREGGIGSLTIQVLDYAPKTRPTTLKLALAPLKLKVGEKEKYRFKINGSSIGEQSASVVREVENPSGRGYEIAYRFEITVPGGASLRSSGALTVLASGKPVHFTLDAEAAGQKQHLLCRFEGQKVKAQIRAGEATADRNLDVPEGSFLIANNLITAFSLITRSLSWEEKKEIQVPVWAANTLQPLTITLKMIRKERLNEKEVFVVDASPIGERFYISAEDGTILKLEDERQKLEIVREEE